MGPGYIPSDFDTAECDMPNSSFESDSRCGSDTSEAALTPTPPGSDEQEFTDSDKCDPTNKKKPKPVSDRLRLLLDKVSRLEVEVGRKEALLTTMHSKDRQAKFTLHVKRDLGKLYRELAEAEGRVRGQRSVDEEWNVKGAKQQDLKTARAASESQRSETHEHAVAKIAQKVQQDMDGRMDAATYNAMRRPESRIARPQNFGIQVQRSINQNGLPYYEFIKSTVDKKSVPNPKFKESNIDLHHGSDPSAAFSSLISETRQHSRPLRNTSSWIDETLQGVSPQLQAIDQVQAQVWNQRDLAASHSQHRRPTLVPQPNIKSQSVDSSGCDLCANQGCDHCKPDWFDTLIKEPTEQECTALETVVATSTDSKDGVIDCRSLDDYPEPSCESREETGHTTPENKEGSYEDSNILPNESAVHLKRNDVHNTTEYAAATAETVAESVITDCSRQHGQESDLPDASSDHGQNKKHESCLNDDGGSNFEWGDVGGGARAEVWGAKPPGELKGSSWGACPRGLEEAAGVDWGCADANSRGNSNTGGGEGWGISEDLVPDIDNIHLDTAESNAKIPAAIEITYWATVEYEKQTIHIPIDRNNVSGPEKAILDGPTKKVWKWVQDKGLGDRVGLQDIFDLARDLHNGYKEEAETLNTARTPPRMTSAASVRPRTPEHCFRGWCEGCGKEIGG